MAGSGRRGDLRGPMAADIVRGAILPAAPKEASRGGGENPDRMLMATAARGGALIHGGGPARGMPGVMGKGRESAAQALVAAPAEDHGVGLAGGMRDRRKARL